MSLPQLDTIPEDMKEFLYTERTHDAYHDDKPYTMFEIPYLKLCMGEKKTNALLEIYEEQEKDKSRWIDWDGSSEAHTDFFIERGKSPYRDRIKEILYYEICRLREVSGMMNPYINGAWFQKYGRGGFHSLHNHGFGYSAVAYLKFNRHKHPPTRFIAPFNDFVTGSSVEFSSHMTEREIIFFPSMIHHYSPPNRCDEDKIIMSMDIKEETSWYCGTCRNNEDEEHF